MPLCLLDFVLLDQLCKTDFPVDIGGVNHFFVLVFWWDVGLFFDSVLALGAADEEAARDQSGNLHDGWFGKEEEQHEATADDVDDRVALRDARGSKVLAIVQAIW